MSPVQATLLGVLTIAAFAGAVILAVEWMSRPTTIQISFQYERSGLTVDLPIALKSDLGWSDYRCALIELRKGTSGYRGFYHHAKMVFDSDRLAKKYFPRLVQVTEDYYMSNDTLGYKLELSGNIIHICYWRT